MRALIRGVGSHEIDARALNSQPRKLISYFSLVATTHPPPDDENQTSTTGEAQRCFLPLDAAIGTLNLARDETSIKPAKDVFSIASVLLTTIRAGLES